MFPGRLPLVYSVYTHIARWCVYLISEYTELLFTLPSPSPIGALVDRSATIETAQRRARLVPRWVTVCRHVCRWWCNLCR